MTAFRALLVACLLGTSATAHFILGYPTSLGFDDDLEPTAPCGGFSIPAAGAATTANSTNVTVGGFAVALQRYFDVPYPFRKRITSLIILLKQLPPRRRLLVPCQYRSKRQRLRQHCASHLRDRSWPILPACSDSPEQLRWQDWSYPGDSRWSRRYSLPGR